MKTIPNLTILLAAGLVLGAASAGAQTIYSTDFTTDDGVMSFNFTQYEGQDPWTLDTGAGVLDLSAAIGGSSSNNLEPGNGGAASAQLPGWSGNNFEIASVMTLTNPGGLSSGSRDNAVGLAFLSDTQDHTGDFYRAEVNVAADGANPGLVSLRKQVGGSSTVLDSFTLDGADFAQGSTLELKVLGSFSGGSLFMDFEVYDGAGNLLGMIDNVEDVSALAGDHFGYRVRAPGGGTNNDPVFNIDFDSFSVVPEPSTVAAVFGGVVLTMTLIVRRRRRA